MKHAYIIDDNVVEVTIQQNEYSFGCSVNLSEHFEDLAQEKDWYDKGFVIEKATSFFSYFKLQKATELVLRKIISELDKSKDLTNFKMEKYHQFVSDDLHLKVIQKMRRLFPEDLSIDTDQILQIFIKYFG